MLYTVSGVRNFITGLDHPEGVAVGRDGTVYAGGESGQVYRISPNAEKVEIIATTGGFCLGMTLDQQENLVICDCGRREVLGVSPEGHIETLVKSVAGRELINPNFSVFDSQGNLYFSDSANGKRQTALSIGSQTTERLRFFLPDHFTLQTDWRWMLLSVGFMWLRAISTAS